MSHFATILKGGLVAALLALTNACVVEATGDGDLGNVDSEIIEDEVEIVQTDELRNPEPQPWRNPGLDAQMDAAGFEADEDDEDNPEPQPWAAAASHSNPEPQPWLPNPEDDGGGDSGGEGDDDDAEPAPVPWLGTTLHFTDRD